MRLVVLFFSIALFSQVVPAQFRPITQPTPIRLYKSFTANENFAVPAGVKRLLIKTWGAGGGGGGAGLNGSTDIAGGNGGTGGFASAIVPVAEADFVEVFIGVGGSKGLRVSNVGFGGSGGFDTYVQIQGVDIIHTAAGGGGGGGDLLSAIGGSGGNGGSSSGDPGGSVPGAVGGGAGSVDQTAITATHGTATVMANTCPTPSIRSNPTAGSSTGVGGICYSGTRTYTPSGITKGAGVSAGAGSRPSGGGGAAGGFALGAGGQGSVSAATGAGGAGAGGGGGGTYLIDELNLPGTVNSINLKSSAGVVSPPIALDGDYSGGAGMAGSGNNVTGTTGGNGGAGLVVIYFYYN